VHSEEVLDLLVLGSPSSSDRFFKFCLDFDILVRLGDEFFIFLNLAVEHFF